MDLNERRVVGQRLFTEVTGQPAPPPTTPLIEMTVDHVLGEVWSRPGLTRKERRLVTLTAVASAGAERALAAHVDGAVDSGDLSIEELRELVLHFAATRATRGRPCCTSPSSALRAGRRARRLDRQRPCCRPFRLAR
jgi:alkylhydroperoxidase/carboxymuconolactone decarboxylase family protein YurZ